MPEKVNNTPRIRKRIYKIKAIVDNPQPVPTVQPPVSAAKKKKPSRQQTPHPTPPKPKGPMITADGVVRCRFDLFVRLEQGTASTFKDMQRKWCFRGDAYTDIESKMLKNLLNLIKNHGQKYFIMELYDNTLPKDNGERLILKIQQKLIRVNRLPEYSAMLTDFPLESILLPYQKKEA